MERPMVTLFVTGAPGDPALHPERGALAIRDALFMFARLGGLLDQAVLFAGSKARCETMRIAWWKFGYRADPMRMFPAELRFEAAPVGAKLPPLEWGVGGPAEDTLGRGRWAGLPEPGLRRVD